MLISLIMQIAQSMQISIWHFLTPQTMHITFPLKNLAVKNISGLTHCMYSSGKWTTTKNWFLADEVFDYFSVERTGLMFMQH